MTNQHDDQQTESAGRPPQGRDYLALVRTDLANERTLLAYGRTALMIAATGLTIVKFFPNTTGIQWLGGTLGAFSALALATGVYRFSSLRKRLRYRTFG